MGKFIRILEVPLYLLVMAMFCVEKDTPNIAIFLVIISIIRLVVNVITDETIYKR
jgi:hypothetical protein